jgi:hypothetical protein
MRVLNAFFGGVNIVIFACSLTHSWVNLVVGVICTVAAFLGKQ